MTVCKFGGSSLADTSQIKKVEAILASDPGRKVTIVSAPGKRHSEDIKITDMLYTCHAEASAGKSFSESFNAVRKRYMEIGQELGIGISNLSDTLDQIELTISRGESADYAASRGEYLCAKILAEYLGSEFLDTEGLIIIADDGSVDPVSYELLSEKLSGDSNFIIPGFYGSAKDGSVKTFTRGGSDITGAIAARACNADLYENWTDVSGILMADPRIVNEPKTIAEITYEEARELASIGAAVFHEEAIAPIRDAAIPIHIKNTNKPEDSGTKIVLHRDDQSQPIVGVSGKIGYTRLFVKKLFLQKNPNFIIKIKTILTIYGIEPEFSSVGFDSISLFFNTNMAGNKEEILTRILTELEPDEISSDAKIAMIGVVGEGLYDSKGIIAKVSTAISEAGVAARYINYGGSLITCVIGVDETDYKTALEAIYSAIA
ncbi:MAG: aspartate kinase [Spirochaetia bacterium]|nr:aspartate kinase [Spirochaetia bacterium]